MTTTEAVQPSPAARTAYLVLGMHRSGTSAVTQLLALAGASLPENVMAGDEHNAKGYFEPWKIAIFNDGRLRAGGRGLGRRLRLPLQAAAAPGRAHLAEPRGEALFDRRIWRGALPLLKDPRVTVLGPFWRTVLDDLAVAARCVIPVRHPLAVAGSLARRNGFPPEKSVLLWSAYMLAAEAYTRDLPRAFVDYDALLADWRGEVARIEAAHGAPLPKLTAQAGKAIDKFLTPDLRHNSAETGLADLGWAGELTQRVLDWFEAAAAGNTPDASPLDEAARDLTRRGQEVGVLISPMTRDLDAARAELLDLRQQVDYGRAEVRRLEAEVAALRREAAEAAVHLNSILADG